MNPANLYQWIEHPETLNRDTLYELRTLVARYPYFQTLRLLFLKNLYLLHDINLGAELRKAALYLADNRVLFYMIEGNRIAMHPQPASPPPVSEEESPDRAFSLIDAFLATVPEGKSAPTELDYSMDYMTYMMQEESSQKDVTSNPDEPAPRLQSQELIDNFLDEDRKSPMLPMNASATEQAPFDEEEEAINRIDESYFTETLAKIYVKQQRYERALEIIKKLSLNYPKKNAYFADQIRFLEKLIINTKSKQ